MKSTSTVGLFRIETLPRYSMCPVTSNLKSITAGSGLVRLWNETFQLRTKLLLSFVLLTVGLTGTTLLAVRRNARAKEQERIEQDARNAMMTFAIFQRQQQESLSHKADLLASMATMRNGDATAIAEVGDNPWQSDECNLFVLADKDGTVQGLRSRGWSFPQTEAQQMLTQSLRRHESSGWWFAAGNLYQIVMQPFYSGAPDNKKLQGFVVVGRTVDDNAARDLARISSSDVVFRYGDQVGVSTLSPLKNLEFTRQSWKHSTATQMDLDGEQYYVRLFGLTQGEEYGPNLVILKSYGALEAYLHWLNQLLFVLGVGAIFLGGGVIFLISHNVTRPLTSLMQGVQALQQGDYSYPLEARGKDELARLTLAFHSMRHTLQNNETQREKLEGQLRQVQKMEALGRLAGGVAHDFNNLLTVIRGHSELLLEKLQPADSLHGHSQQIKKTSDRAAALTRQLLAFSRMQVLQPKVLDVNELLVEMGKLLRRLIREDIEFCLRLGESVGRVKGDPGQLEQVFLNLAVNASDAMLTGGKLTIETQNVQVDQEYTRTRPSVEPGQYVVISVTDTGHGMDAATKARIFEPFFTTKERGKGTGLGLATVYGVVKQTGGYIWVESELGEGTRFEVYLPSTEDRVEARVNDGTLKNGMAHVRPNTVLIVEDEKDVRELACEFLTSAGYKVLAAEDGWEGLQMAKRLGPAIQAVLTDLVMPKIGGHELGTRLHSLLPQLKIVYMTGYLEQSDANGELVEEGYFIQKPFSRDTLIAKLDEALRTERAARYPKIEALA
jgi:signal transduction histidine kinase/ActR/RegA family two-component response regulator